jgi:hypothetical protein
MKPMNKKLTFLLSLTFLFLYPSISLSQTFKCEFIQEKFKGGKSNEATCSGDPELSFSSKNHTTPRHEHCDIDIVNHYNDYIDFNIDTSNKTVTYNVKSGKTSHGMDMSVLRHKRKGDMSEEEVRESYGKTRIRTQEGLEMTVQSFSQMVEKNKGNNFKGNKTTSYLITYKTVYPKRITENEDFYTLYIPQSGKSTLSEYHTFTDQNDSSSWVSLKFGKCENTSK